MVHGGVDDQTGGRARRMGLVTASFAMAASAVAMFVCTPAAFAAPSGDSCVAATQGAQVHFITDFSAGSPGGAAISGLTISGFDSAACDGLPVTVVISGNTAGAGGSPADLLLSTLDSTLDPCSGVKLGTPVTIAGGTITLTGCASVHDPKAAAYASIHDATQLAVTVAGSALTVGIGGVATTNAPPPPPITTSSVAAPPSTSGAGVAGVSTSKNPPSGATSAGNGNAGQSTGSQGLASTGTDIALLTLIGLLLIGFGALLMRRRRSARGH